MIVIFDRPIWLTESTADIRSVFETYGIIVEDELLEDPYLKKKLNNYIGFLCGASLWEQEGNNVNGVSFLSDKVKKAYQESDPIIKKYLSKARKQMGVGWSVYLTSKKLEKSKSGIRSGYFIVSRNLSQNIKKYGRKVSLCGCRKLTKYFVRENRA